MTDYRHLYDSAPVGLWQTRISDGKFLSANKKTCDLLGYSSFNELSEKCSVDFYPETERNELLSQLMKKKELKDYPIAMRRKDGKELTFLVSAKIYTEENYIEGSLRDVTDELSLEAKIVPHIRKMSKLRANIIQKLESVAYNF